MRQQTITIPLRIYQPEELSAEDARLIEAAKQATYSSYAPYSHFSVGAAALLANGETVSGSNQENAAYPSGLCAERTALFYASARYPDQPVVTLAVAARGTDGEFLPHPIPPCGACRQVMLEVQNRHHTPLRVLLYGTKGICELTGVEQLLPLTFDGTYL